MNDTCFVDLIKEENLHKIDIDKRLIGAFELAMIKTQEYFNKNNYINGKRYADFFDKFLLKNSERKLKIIVSNELTEGTAGAYSSEACTLYVNNDFINSDIDVLAHIICHEFIHFITHHVNDILYGDKWSGESFIDEGFTEELARKIIPVDVEYYGPIPNLIDFYKKLSNTEIDSSVLLEGKIPDLLRVDFFPKSFILYGDNCIERFKNGEYIDNGFENDENYLYIQREIIANWNCNEINDYDSLMSFMSIISSRPADDREWIIDYVINKCSNIIEDEETRQLIIEYINCLNIISTHIYKFSVGNIILTFDGENVFGITPDIKYYFTENNGMELLVFYDNNGNKALLEYKNMNLLNKDALLANKDRLEEALRNKITTKFVK